MILIFYLIVQFILLKADVIVDETNCRNDEILKSNCKFIIVLKRPILNKIGCTLVFKEKNSSAVELIIGKITLIQKVQGRCPNLYINIASADNTINKLSTICGGYINPINHKFDRFKSAYFRYDNKGLYDNSSNINITFDLVEKKEDICFKQDQKFSLETWHMILIVVVILSLMFLIILSSILIIIFEICKKKGSKKAPVVEQTTNEEKKSIDSPDTNNDNSELENKLILFWKRLRINLEPEKS